MNDFNKPTHPGIFLKKSVLDERGISITEGANYLGVSRKSLSEFVNGKAKCSTTMARRISVSTGSEVSFWINMQNNLDIWEAERMKPPRNIKAMPSDDEFK